MTSLLFFLLSVVIAGELKMPRQDKAELQIVHELFGPKSPFGSADVPRKIITKSDKSFWKAHPKNKFEMIKPIEIMTTAGITMAIVIGKEYLDGASFKYEKIEIKFDRNKKIFSFRGFSWKK